MSPLRPNPPPRARWVLIVLVGLGTIMMMRLLAYYAGQFHRQLSYSEFYRLVQENPQEIAEAKLVDDHVEGRLKSGTTFTVFVVPRDEELFKLLRQNVPTFDV